MCANSDAATPNAMTNVRSNSSSSGVATRWRSCGSRPAMRRTRCATTLAERLVRRIARWFVHATAPSDGGDRTGLPVHPLHSRDGRPEEVGHRCEWIPRLARHPATGATRRRRPSSPAQDELDRCHRGPGRGAPVRRRLRRRRPPRSDGRSRRRLLLRRRHPGLAARPGAAVSHQRRRVAARARRGRRRGPAGGSSSPAASAPSASRSDGGQPPRKTR